MYYNTYDAAVPSDYVVISRSTELPVDLETVKEQLRIDDDEQDSYITLLIQAATSVAELITKRDLSPKTYKVFLDSFLYSNGFELRRSPLISVDSIRYFKSRSLTTIDANDYYITQSPTFGSVYPVEQWPNDVDDNRRQAIEIQFQAGYNIDRTSDPVVNDVPLDLQIAIMQHITSLYENRGDCSNLQRCASTVPCSAMSIYNLYKIVDLRVFK